MTNVPQPPGQDPESDISGFVGNLLATLHEHTDRKPKAKAETPQAKPYDAPDAFGEGDEDVIRLIRKDRRGSALWQGQWEGLGLEDSSHSGADFALMQRLAFYTAKNPAQMDGLFRRSALYREAKWDSPRPGGTYGSLTIDAAIAATTDVYSRRVRVPSPPAMAAGGSGAATAPAMAAAPARSTLNLLPFTPTDTGNSQRVELLYGPELHYSAAESSWYVWSEGGWRREELKALSMAKLMAEEFLRQAQEAARIAAAGGSDEDRKQANATVKFALETLNKHRLENALALFAPMVAIDSTAFDRQPNLLNSKNGTVELRTGTLQPHRREDLLTKQTRVSYRPEAKCPQFMAFLSHAMGHTPDASESELASSAEKIAYLQRALGYSITGETGEKVVFLAQGPPDTGKTTLLGLVRELLGSYALEIPLTVIMATNRSASADSAVADLRGMRFAQTSELDQDQRMSTGLLKQICQGPGGRITACRKYENPITFAETHKLWIDANHKPSLSATDDAAWRRLKLIPFIVEIPKDQQDGGLYERLMAEEGEGILAWLVEGARLWYAHGLAKSDIVDKATGDWRAEASKLKLFLEDATVTEVQASIPNQNLYGSYKAWTEENGERPLSHRKFHDEMENLGYSSKRATAGMEWLGLRFRLPK